MQAAKGEGSAQVPRRSIEQRLRRWAWRLWMAPTRLLEHHVRSRLLRYRVRHVSGPEVVDYAPDEVLAICVVRNGSLHIRSFIEHHQQLGVRHIVFLDNGSTDETVAIAQEYPNVTILSSDCPYRKYENVMKRYLALRFSRARWNLCVDVDELFDYPCSDVLSLSDFLTFLNANRYNAVLAHMLDMFAGRPLTDCAEAPSASLREAYPYYDIANIHKSEYTWSPVPYPSIQMHWGGIRRTIFGTNNGLSKAALVRVEEDLELFVDWHQVANARIADVTGVLFHYPFVNCFANKVRDAVRTGRYGYRTTGEYRRYWRALQQEPELQIKSDTAQRFTDLKALLEEGFLVASPAFRAWVSERGVQSPPRRAAGDPRAS